MSNLFNQALKANPLVSRKDFEAALIQLIEPVYHLMAEQQTPGRFHLSDSGSVYSEDRRDIEGFLRTLWGLGPLFTTAEKTREYSTYFQAANQGILTGTDPTDPLYWGELNDYDQLFVEMGALATYLIMTKEYFWDQLGEDQQTQIYQWLDQINHHTIPATNWLFFRILVNTFFELSDQAFSPAKLAEDLSLIDQFYLAEGWYFDGYEKQIDYYIPFAMQYYGLLFTKLAPHASAREKFLKRGADFARTFKNWFVNNGAALPFGRSLTYRFAQSAYFSAGLLALDEFTDVTQPEAKYLLFNNLRHWFQQPIFTPEGCLSIGYHYPNLVMAEGYNAPGSPYWALKSFLVLALPPEDPFWDLPETQPTFAQKEKNPYSRMLLVHDETGDELQAFTAGQHSHEHAHGEAKYEKFVYSTTFGFSVKKADILAKQGAFDNTLAVSEGLTHFKSVFDYTDYAIHDEYIYGKWEPWPDCMIETFIIPCYPWHIRLHVIDSQRPLNYLAGSFSAPTTGPVAETIAPAAYYASSVGLTGIKSLSPAMSCSLTQPEPNTNLLYARTVLPQASGQLAIGKQELLYACVGAAGKNYADPAQLPEIIARREGQQLFYTLAGCEHQVTLQEL